MNSVALKQYVTICNGILLLLTIATSSAGQNLVPNPSFENNVVCPGSYSRAKTEFKVPGWYSPSEGTPDAFHECARGEADVPHNWAGVSEAYDGSGYVGIYVWLQRRGFREYIQCALTQNLIKDSTYKISFNYRLSSYSMFAANAIGLLLSDSMVTQKHDRAWAIRPTLSVRHDSALTLMTGLWETAAMEYKATGGEKFLTIGNFLDDKETEVYKIKYRPVQQYMLEDAAYYYIDLVTVRLKFDPIEPMPILASFTKDDVKPNERYVLDNIHFNFNSYKLQARSFSQLDEVVEFLSNNPGFNVRISGHTDDVGSDGYNMTLSERRAKTVATYLAQKGIKTERIQSRGFGKKLPLYEGTSEEVRRQNRRVELVFF